MQTVTEKIDALIREPLAARGYRLVRIKLMEQGRRRTLQVMAERASDGQMNVEDCSQLSQVISALLDVEDPISGHYDLEISSPGIDRPLVTQEDFLRYIGHEAKIETHGLVEGRKRFRGVLQAMESERVDITCDQQRFSLPLAAIASAQLVLTDALIKKATG